MTTPDRVKQVETTKANHGEDHYKKIGSAGGKISPGKFDSERGRAAINARWAKYRADQELKAQQRKEQQNG